MTKITCLPIITLHVNRLNVLIKIYRMNDWIKKTKINQYAAPKRFTSELKSHTD